MAILFDYLTNRKYSQACITGGTPVPPVPPVPRNHRRDACATCATCATQSQAGCLCHAKKDLVK